MFLTIATDLAYALKQITQLQHLDQARRALDALLRIQDAILEPTDATEE